MFDDDYDDDDDDHDMDWDKVLRGALTSVVEWRPQEEEHCFVQLVEVVINQAIHYHYQSGAGKKIKYENIGGDGYNYKTKLMDPVQIGLQDTVQAEHTEGCQAGVRPHDTRRAAAAVREACHAAEAAHAPRAAVRASARALLPAVRLAETNIIIKPFLTQPTTTLAIVVEVRTHLIFVVFTLLFL
ncbi:unnamed protein product [Macrosiphum euphorbiae]|uniref:Uncharacterized protein n=1 Tax=Macrosiphum euphorbiae TaxID=13131 RepID=A0AAV0W9E4_9HEMI|nr:unnamed protein product [Macrosiphum euphorbiae]